MFLKLSAANCTQINHRRHQEIRVQNFIIYIYILHQQPGKKHAERIRPDMIKKQYFNPDKDTHKTSEMMEMLLFDNHNKPKRSNSKRN